MAIEPPSSTLFNELEEEREYRADVRAALAALIVGEFAGRREYATGRPYADAAAQDAHRYADALRTEREKRKALK